MLEAEGFQHMAQRLDERENLARDFMARRGRII
jgi:hypothetical protein